MSYNLIIFDCDGTLVDTEDLSNQVHSKNFIDFGLTEYTPEKCLIEFTGSSWSNIKQKVESKHGVNLPESMFQNYIDSMLKYVETENIEIEGSLNFVKQALNKTKIAVGSNGMRANVIKSLEVSGFMNLFTEDQVFTKQDVKNPKPAPDLFLFAAEKMSVDPPQCLVIEDSPTGAKAGIAAGMDVFGFTGTAHDKNAQKEALLKVGAKAVFNDFIHMQEELGL